MPACGIERQGHVLLEPKDIYWQMIRGGNELKLTMRVGVNFKRKESRARTIRAACFLKTLQF